jgi:[acyl-carrier-protein] S-malonyltransferase
MPEYHPGTDIEIPDNVPGSAFRNAIPNVKRYMKHNTKTLDDVAEASFTGDFDALEVLLESGDEKNLFNGDINCFHSTLTPLQLAAMAGQLECVELLLKAKADPHIKENMAYGQDPEDGRSALEFAKEWGYDEIVEILEDAKKDYKYGWYVPAGTKNNAKVYGCWEHGTVPKKGWSSGRPGMAEMCGFDPMKYGTGPLKMDDGDDDILGDAPVAVAGAPKAAVVAADTVPVCLLFPGQGSQYVKMMNAVKDIPKVAEYLDKAKSILGWDVLDKCLNGPESELEETRVCQPAMFIASLAGLESMKKDNPEHATKFSTLAGLSLGEYTALCVAGVFTFEDGLELVKLRGEEMQKAATVGKQLMLSVAGVEKPKLTELCKEAAKKEGAGAVCQIANELFPKGFSCAGTETAIMALKDLAEKAGALQAKVLKTSGAFHTQLMAPAAEALGKKLEELLPKMNPPTKTVYMNATAEPIKPGTNPKEIVALMKKQLTNPVLWEPSIHAIIKSGVETFYEVGPMKQLKAMMKRINTKVWQTTTNIEV